MIVEVAAAVIQRPDGSFLLAQRPQGKVYAGYWEFPGGKVEPGETPHRALCRELHEELGIEVERAYRWITRTYTYPHATVRLRFFRVVSFRNEPHPREDQAIAWQRLDAPMASPMLPANAPVLTSLALPPEYAVTAAGALGTEAMIACLEQRLDEGLKLLQVREPDLAEEEMTRLTRRVITLAHAHGCKVMVKAPFEGADGIHFTAAQLQALSERPKGLLAAASCHTRAELERAMALALDFAVVGPVKASASHPRAPGMGWEKFTRLVEDSTIPVFAIGGMDHHDFESGWSAGAHGLAMLSAAWRRTTTDR